MKRYRPHLFVLFILGVVQLTGLQQFLANVLIDHRFGVVSRPASGQIVIVGIDSPSMDKIGVWPWSRSVHASLVDKLLSAGVQDIAFDVDFSAASDIAGDNALTEALRRAGGSVILPTFEQWIIRQNEAPRLHVTQPLPKFEKLSWSAIVNVSPDQDGLVRRYGFGKQLNGEFLPSMGSLIAGEHKQDAATFYIDYGITHPSVPTVSAVKVLMDEPGTLQFLKGKRVIIGSLALELGDRLNVPRGKILAGVIVQALAAESILQKRTLTLTSPIFAAAGLCLIFFVMFFSWQIAASYRAVVLVCFSVAAEATALLVQTSYPILLNTALVHAGVLVYLLTIALDEIDVQSLLRNMGEKRFQQIAKSIGDPLVCADHNGNITAWNSSAESVFGYRAEEITGQPFSTLVASRTFSLVRIPTQALQYLGAMSLELTGRKSDGTLFPIEGCFSAWEGPEGTQYGAVLRDISVRKREEERIRFLAESDTLTGLWNRSSLHLHLSTAIAARNEIALLILDIDRFKEINNTRGHSFGDLVLRAVAEKLKTIAGQDHFIARVGGDEFVVAIQAGEAETKIRQLAGLLETILCEELEVETKPANITACIGWAAYPSLSASADELISNADLALNRARALGRGRSQGFESTIRQELEARLSLESELRIAFAENQFELFYQPQIDLNSGNIIGAEALIRWWHPVRGLITPGDFIPVLNASSLSNDVAYWVIETACSKAAEWNAMGRTLQIGVNLSPSQFQSSTELPYRVAKILASTGLPAHLLELEVTEEILLDDVQKVSAIFSAIRQLGVHLAFDDFGTGYASLSHLQKFTFNTLKIDRSFVRELKPGSGDAAIVRATIALAGGLGLSVTAEGIEDDSAIEMLRAMGCEKGQGYFYGRPMSAEAFDKFEVNLQYSRQHDTVAA